MDRFLNPLGLPPQGCGQLAHALGIDRRRASPHATQLRRGPHRRNTMEPIVPNLLETDGNSDITFRRRSMPARITSVVRDINVYGMESALPQPFAANNHLSRDYNGANGEFTVNSNSAFSRNVDRQWALVDIVGVPRVREDYYSTLIASASSSYPWENEDWAFMHESSYDSCDEDLLSLNRLGEVLLAATWYACRWTRQLGPQLFKHHTRGLVTCIAVTRLGYCVMGDNEGYLLLFDMVPDPPPLLLRQHLRDIVSFDGGDSNIDRSKQYAMHLIWSDKVPLVYGTALSRCGYRVEFLVGTSQGAICKVFVDKTLKFVTELVTPPQLWHSQGISAMSFDYNQDMLVVAGVDNEVSIWIHLTSAQSTTLQYQYRFRQFSTIKGMSFCPGLDQLIALGGGRRDRVLRIYDIEERKLVKQISMPAQIVGIVWVSRWEVFIALGHSRLRHYTGLGKVYNLATGKIVCDLPGPGYALSAVRTNSGVSIYTSEYILMDFRWTPEASPRSSRDVLASLKVSYPPTTLR